MNIEIMREFFGWMTLINLLMYSWTAIACIFMKDFLNKVVGKMFGVSDEFNRAALYSYVAAYKVLFIVFNLVPWLALVIMT